MDVGDNETATIHPDYAPRTPSLPEYPHSSEWVIDMNYLMPFSVMLMILCVLLLILCYLRHRMRQRRQLQHQLRQRQMMISDPTTIQFIDGDYITPMLPDRVRMMYPPSYDEAALQNSGSMQKHTWGATESPPPYTEYMPHLVQAANQSPNPVEENSTAQASGSNEHIAVNTSQ